MLNRTNRTLSANSNRLNLGTRKLDQNASANNGSLTLRTATAHASPVVVTVRTGVAPYPGFMFAEPPIMEPKPLKPAMHSMSGSSPESSRPAQGFWAWDQGQTVPLSSQPAQPGSVLRDVVGTGRGVTPRVATPSQRQARSSLAWHCDRMRLAGRSARAALALVTEVASTRRRLGG
jgi:hypothetical protein